MLNQTIARRLPLTLCVALAAVAAPGAALGDPIVLLHHETFDGYGPRFDPEQWPEQLDYDMPLIEEGADEYWHGGRFGPSEYGLGVREGLFVQESAGANETPVGHFRDGVGLLLHVAVEEAYALMLEFDAASAGATGDDRLRVGYHFGELGYGGEGEGEGVDGRCRDFHADFATDADAEAWWQNAWTELLAYQGEDWTHHVAELPVGQRDGGSLWLAFWMDGDSYFDVGLIDNVRVSAVNPEPASLCLMGVGALLMGVRRR